KDAVGDWNEVERRLLKCQLLRHPNLLQVLETRLNASPPTVVTQWRETRTLESLWRDQLPAPLETVLHLGRTLAEIVEIAHRFGVTLDNLTPAGVGLDD